MRIISLADAKAHLSELLNAVEGGEEVVITRHGHAVARLAAVDAPKQPVQSRSAFRARMPRWRKSSALLLRTLRDEER
ncbi:MAG: type II toxin-antitoxin system Phd/YefM family antitoxin [Acidiferrobacteraceae bacterium]